MTREIADGSTVEISMEANPSDINNTAQDFKSAGVTRLSLGIQSFQDRYNALLSVCLSVCPIWSIHDHLIL